MTWADFKDTVKKKVAENRKRRRGTGGGPPPKDLPPLYEKTVEIIGDILIEGDLTVEETCRKKNSESSNICEDVHGSQEIDDHLYICEVIEVDNESQLPNTSLHEEIVTSTPTGTSRLCGEIGTSTPTGQNKMIPSISRRPKDITTTPIVKISHKNKFNSETAPNMSQLIVEECKKAEAIIKLAEAMERSNEINSERNEIERERNERYYEINMERNRIERERNAIEKERNSTFQSTAATFIDLLQKFTSTT